MMQKKNDIQAFSSDKKYPPSGPQATPEAKTVLETISMTEGDGREDIHSIYRKLSLPIWGFLLFSVLTITGLLYMATAGQDRNAIQASVHLANGAILAMEQSLSELSVEYAYWDQAVEKLVTKFDPDWADSNIGPFLVETYEVYSSYVVGKDNQLIYSSIEGERLFDDPLIRFSGGLDILIRNTRSGLPSAAPIPAIGLILDNGIIYLASAVVLTNYLIQDGVEVTRRTNTVLILTKKLSQNLLNKLSVNYQLPNLRLHPHIENTAMVSTPLFSVDKIKIGSLVWEPYLPGSRIMLMLILGVFCVFILMAGILFEFLRRVKDFSFQLNQKSDLLISTLNSVDQGIAAWDKQNRLVSWNSKCGDFWCHPENVTIGMTKLDLIKQVSRGTELSSATSGVLDKYCHALIANKTNSELEFKLIDGRYISIFHFPIPGGGHTTVYSDITERKIAENQLVQQATIDQVTDLPNRVLLCDRIAMAIENARREQKKIGLLFVDLDKFKPINDTYGHAVGDQLLKHVGKRLVNQVREADTVARLGGDEFVIVLSDVKIRTGAEIVAKKIIEAFKLPFIIGERELFITASLGIAIFPDDGEDVDKLLQKSDEAMYQSKKQGRNSYRFFKSD